MPCCCPWGSTSLAIRLSESSASPRVKPGARFAVSVAERTRSKWFSSRGPTPFLHVGERLQLDQLAAPAAHVQAGHVARRGPRAGVELHDHVVLLVGPGECAGLVPAQKHLERGGHVRHRHPQVFGPIPVEADGELGLVDPEVAVHVDQTSDLPGPGQQGVVALGQQVEVGVLDDEVDRASPAKGRRVVGKGEDARDGEVLGLHLPDDLLHRAVRAWTSRPGW